MSYRQLLREPSRRSRANEHTTPDGKVTHVLAHLGLKERELLPSQVRAVLEHVGQEGVDVGRMIRHW